MLDTHALRYLLLRQFWTLKNDANPQVYEEVCASLTVDKDGRDYVIGWSRGGTASSKRIARSAYTFYVKGDQSDSPGAQGEAERRNLELARALAGEALGVSGPGFSAKPQGRRWTQADSAAFGWHIVVCSGVALTAPSGQELVALVLLTAYAVEYVPRYGRALTALAFLAFLPLRLPVCALLGGIAYGLSNFLDPNPTLRTARLALCGAAVVGGVALLDPGRIELEMLIGGAAMLAVLSPVALFRWTAGTHERALPLVLPVLAASLYVDAGRLAATVLAAGTIVACVGRLFVWKQTARRA